MTVSPIPRCVKSPLRTTPCGNGCTQIDAVWHLKSCDMIPTITNGAETVLQLTCYRLGQKVTFWVDSRATKTRRTVPTVTMAPPQMPLPTLILIHRTNMPEIGLQNIRQGRFGKHAKYLCRLVFSLNDNCKYNCKR